MSELSLSPTLKYAVLGYLYAAVSLTSYQSLWPFLPEPGFAWCLAIALPPGLAVSLLARWIQGTQARRISAFEGILALNALLLWLVISLDY